MSKVQHNSKGLSPLDRAILDVYNMPRFTPQGDSAVDRMMSIVRVGTNSEQARLDASILGIRCSSPNSDAERNAVAGFSEVLAELPQDMVQAAKESADRQLWNDYRKQSGGEILPGQRSRILAGKRERGILGHHPQRTGPIGGLLR
jgi:hypothetical protein